jgi:hypothetical protein
LELFGASLTNVGLYSFGVGYETDRKYFLWTISSASDTYATQAFVWNTFTQTWTRWTKHAECALVSSVDDKLYIGSTTTNYLLQEKKSYGFADQVDYGFTTTVNSVSVDGLTVDIGLTDEISAGDVIYQSSTAFSIVSAVDTTAGTCAMSFVGGLTAGAATIYRAIQTEVQWVGIHAGNAGLMKHFREVSLIFRRSRLTSHGARTRSRWRGRRWDSGDISTGARLRGAAKLGGVPRGRSSRWKNNAARFST